jgi:hypothetical protein
MVSLTSQVTERQGFSLKSYFGCALVAQTDSPMSSVPDMPSPSTRPLNR